MRRTKRHIRPAKHELSYSSSQHRKDMLVNFRITEKEVNRFYFMQMHYNGQWNQPVKV